VIAAVAIGIAMFFVGRSQAGPAVPDRRGPPGPYREGPPPPPDGPGAAPREP
jgi:hypothetical protein